MISSWKSTNIMNYALTLGMLCGMLFISSCGDDDDGGGPVDPGIDVDQLLSTAVVDFTDPSALNLVGVTNFTTGIGNGYTFDQSAEGTTCGVESSYIGLPDLGAIWADGFTVAGWVNFSESRKFERIIDLGQDVEMNIGDNIGENGALNITFARIDETNDLGLTSWINDDGTLNKSTGRLVAEGAIVNGTTQFYVGTISPSGEMRIYVDGQLVASKSDGHPVVNEARTSNFAGRSNWCFFDLDFKGSMSGLWIFNEVLTQEEITAIYEDGADEI